MIGSSILFLASTGLPKFDAVVAASSVEGNGMIPSKRGDDLEATLMIGIIDQNLRCFTPAVAKKLQSDAKERDEIFPEMADLATGMAFLGLPGLFTVERSHTDSD